MSNIRVFEGAGRPTFEESERRRREFVRLVAAGVAFDEAARLAKVKPLRALRLLSEPELRQVIAQAAA